MESAHENCELRSRWVCCFHDDKRRPCCDKAAPIVKSDYLGIARTCAAFSPLSRIAMNHWLEVHNVLWWKDSVKGRGLPLLCNRHYTELRLRDVRERFCRCVSLCLMHWLA